MIEARSFVPELETARKILEDQEAVFKGEYQLTDAIFASIDPAKGIEKEFLRLRTYGKNIWNEKDVIVAIKQTDQKEIGIDSIVPLRKEFDSETEARSFIEENLADRFKYDFTFTRTGWQYDLGEDQIDLERVDDLENCYVIEFKSPTINGLHKLKSLLNLETVIQGPIALEMKKRLLE